VVHNVIYCWNVPYSLRGDRIHFILGW